MSDGFSLRDALFNAETVAQLGREFSRGVDGFDAATFVDTAMAGLAERDLLDRLEWLATCLEPQLPAAFPEMADALEAAMPPPLDPSLRDDDFGQFIHAIPGVLAVRHGLHAHPDRALDLLHAGTQRFSMERYIRPFLDHWPEKTLARLDEWVGDPNYHVRRLVSEGTRPVLPWAPRLALDPAVPLRFLDALHSDPTRYVTRSVANHLNDLTKIIPDAVYERLGSWAKVGRAEGAELAWLTRHALRSEIKAGAPHAMDMLGYRRDAEIRLEHFEIAPTDPQLGGTAEIHVVLVAEPDLPVLVDYVMHLRKANGRLAPKVYKMKDTAADAGGRLALTKRHRFKAGASTFTLREGRQEVSVQVNGRTLGTLPFTLRP
ncbi:MAG: hypothetical protein AAF914_07570 [Pseudomonadota bacterium]